MGKKVIKLGSLFCVLALLVGALLGDVAVADEVTVYQIALNDRLKPIASEFSPILSGGAYYVPYTIFDKNVTEVNLGTSYGQVKGEDIHTLTLYSANNILVFDVLAGTCATSTGESVELKAFLRNGRVYVPVAVCRYFSGLQYSFTPTMYGTLIRITNGMEILGTKDFVEVAAGLMQRQYNKYLEGTAVPTPTPPPTSAVTPTPTPTPTPGTTPTTPGVVENPSREDVRVYLAFRCEGGGGVAALLSQLENSGVRALFFFRPEELTQNASIVRRIVGSGHGVGLLVDGTSADALFQSLAQGSALLERVAHLRTHTVLVDGAAAATVSQLQQEGWAVWQGNVDGTTRGRSQTALSRVVLENIATKRNVAWVTMDDSATAAALARILTQLQADQYSIRQAVETHLP